MKPDAEYLKRLLTAFRESPEPTTDIEELTAAGVPCGDPNFIFHMLLLRDQQFVTDDYDNSLGYVRSLDGYESWSVIPLRLTASGYEFAELLSDEKIMAEIKNSWIGASLSTMFQVGTRYKTEIVNHHNYSATGPNARVNVSSVDNSSNTVQTAAPEMLALIVELSKAHGSPEVQKVAEEAKAAYPDKELTATKIAAWVSLASSSAHLMHQAIPSLNEIYKWLGN